MLALWKQGRGVGGTFSQRGQEAISVGAASALGPDDVVSPMHRDLGAFLLRGLTPRELFGNLLGRVTGPTQGRDANLHGVSALDRGIIGFISHLPQGLSVALSVAMSFRYRSEPRVAMVFTGDGASNSGLYHEVLNREAWEARDPVIGFRRKLSAEGVGDEQLDEIERRCREEVEDAVAFAEAGPWPDPATVTDGVYAP
jgi:TPP-dependent pyruvate/acetoin dehydrogenase alpha subunit